MLRKKSRTTLCVCALGASAFLSVSAAATELLPVDLRLVPPGGGKNAIDLTIEGDVLGTKKTSSDSADVSGNMLATLGIAIDPATYEVVRVETIEFTGGRIAISDTSFSLNWGLIVGRVDIDATGVGGTLRTPNPPGLVADGLFNAAEHEVVLDAGVFSARGTGLIGGFMPENPYVIDLAANPLAATTDAIGSIAVSSPDVAPGTVSYDVTLTLPVFLDQIVLEEPGQASVRVVGTATLESRGRIVLAADYGKVAAPASTGLEEASVGATSFRRGAGNREIEWSAEVIQVTTYAAVDGSFQDPADPQNRKQFHLNNASAVIRTERIDTRGVANLQISIDLRTWDTSTGFEAEDGVTLSVRRSRDGILFEDLAWTEVRGAAATALSKGRDGAFTTYRTPSGFFPEGTASVIVAIAASTNSASEHLFWDNLRVSSPVRFRRGDCDGTGSVDVADALKTLLWLFVQGSARPPCLDACDANDDGSVSLADPLYALRWIFRGGPVPPAPGPAACGLDPTPADAVGCDAYPGCP